ITNASITGLAPATVRYSATGVGALNINTPSSRGNNFNILSTPNHGTVGTVTTTLNGVNGEGTGSKVTVGSSGTLTGIQGNLVMARTPQEGRGGAASKPPRGHRIRARRAALIGRARGAITFIYYTPPRLDVEGGTGFNTFNVLSTPYAGSVFNGTAM